jgi:hypothetical protein
MSFYATTFEQETVMKNTQKLMSVMLLTSLSAAADVQWIEQPVSHELMNLNQKAFLVNTSQEPVVFNQSLLGEALPVFHNQGHQAESRQFWMDVDASMLSKGVEIPLTSSEAVIRISPLPGNNHQKAVQSGQLILSQHDQSLTPEVFVTGEQLKATGMPASDQTVAFKVATLPGKLNLKMAGLPSTGGYAIHVLEPNSEQVMTLKTTQQAFASGQEVVIKAGLLSQQKHQAMQVNGYLTQPDGQRVAGLKFHADQDGQYQAVVSGLTGQSLAKGLWEVHTVSEAMVDGQKVLRDVSTAFAINLPSARFNGELSMDQQLIRLGVDNAMPARYGISGVLTGVNKQGEQQPIALMMSAQWLEAGQTNLAFEWPAELVAASGLQAPFTVEQLALKNQSLLAPVQTVARGFRIQDFSSQVNDLK